VKVDTSVQSVIKHFHLKGGKKMTLLNLILAKPLQRHLKQAMYVIHATGKCRAMRRVNNGNGTAMIGDIIILALILAIFWPLLLIPLTGLILLGALIQDIYNWVRGRRYDPIEQEYK